MQNVHELLLAYRKKKAAGISTNTKPDSQISMKPFPLFLSLRKSL